MFQWTFRPSLSCVSRLFWPTIVASAIQLVNLVNPYLAGGLFVDYLVRGRCPIAPKHPLVLTPDDLTAGACPTYASRLLIAHSRATDHPDGAGLQAPRLALAGSSELPLMLIASPVCKR
jgi:hypothetical protein